MTGPGDDRSLSRREFDLVIRRAADLAAQESESRGDGLKEADVYRIAQEVGLSEQHVRTALSEIRAGADPTRLVDRVYGPARVIVSRVVPGSPATVGQNLDEFMVGGRLLQRVRRTDRYLQYRPAVDWISSLARAASSTSKRYYVASAKSVEVRLDAVDEDQTLVTVEVDPGIRGDWVAGGLAGGGAAGIGGGLGVAVATASVAPDLVGVAAGLAFAGGFFWFINALTARYHKRKWLEVRAETEGVLDQLESGESLEPPPASWRKWVERQFHGARRLIEQDDDDIA
ncbi:MAG TPA: hypothetical protein VK858_18145 [Longimicrobiales bacterium]|nr:hypothetical protein [Longimicrobiales bacterium]